MKSEWITHTFGDVCLRIYSGGTPSTKQAEYWNGEINWLSSGETGKRYIYDTDRKITELGVSKSSTQLAHKGDTVVASAGQGYTRGQASYLLIDTYVNQSVIVFHANAEVIDDKFLFFNLGSRYEELRQLSDGTSTRGGLSGWIVKRMEIDLPPLDEQKQIVGILSAIDNKIELNTMINENLEQQAQAIFRSWFVDFEPFGGVMPDDWRMGTLSEIAEINSGKRPPMRQADKTDNVYVPLVGAASVMGYTNESNHSDKILVIGRVGTHGIVQRFNIPCWTSDNTLVLTSPYYEYTYQVLKRIDYTAMNRGSTQPLITQGDMNKAEIFLPDEKYILKYESLVGTLFAQYEHNRAENENLAALRDTLLPKLMNGEIDVSEVNI